MKISLREAQPVWEIFQITHIRIEVRGSKLSVCFEYGEHNRLAEKLFKGAAEAEEEGNRILNDLEDDGFARVDFYAEGGDD